MAREPVRVNVYDMYWLNEYASPLGVGVFHAGIEVYGVEYAYGGHPFAFSGIFELTPQSAEELGDNFRFRESIVLGETDFSGQEIRKMVQQMGLEYRGDQYHLINKNCNHFSAALAKTLTGKEIPAWINRLANLSASVPFISRMIPAEWLTPAALQQTLDSEASAARRVNNTSGPLDLHAGRASGSSSSSQSARGMANGASRHSPPTPGRSGSTSERGGSAREDGGRRYAQ